jgi:hypothetical protein
MKEICKMILASRLIQCLSEFSLPTIPALQYLTSTVEVTALPTPIAIELKVIANLDQETMKEICKMILVSWLPD